MEHIIFAIAGIFTFLINIPTMRGMLERSRLEPGERHYVRRSRAVAAVWIWSFGMLFFTAFLFIAIITRPH